LAGGVMFTGTNVCFPTSTMRPFTLSRSAARNAVSSGGVGRSGMFSWYACAVTVPSVPGVHATTSHVS
jgi:hypothetical protein